MRVVNEVCSGYTWRECAGHGRRSLDAPRPSGAFLSISRSVDLSSSRFDGESIIPPTPTLTVQGTK